MKNQLHVVSTSTFILVCLLFFLPFLDIECGNQKLIVVSGTELVTGFTMNVPSYGGDRSSKKSEPNIFAIVALLSSIAGAVVSFVLKGKKIFKSAVITISAIISAALLILQIEMNSRVSSQAKEVMVRVNYEIGYWLCLIIPIFLIVFMLVIKSDTKTSSDTTSAI